MPKGRRERNSFGPEGIQEGERFLERIQDKAGNEIFSQLADPEAWRDFVLEFMFGESPLELTDGQEAFFEFIRNEINDAFGIQRIMWDAGVQRFREHGRFATEQTFWGRLRNQMDVEPFVRRG